MIDNNCAYCVEGDLVAKFGIKICELETSKVYLFKEQSHPGRCIVAHKKHVGDRMSSQQKKELHILRMLQELQEQLWLHSIRIK